MSIPFLSAGSSRPDEHNDDKNDERERWNQKYRAVAAQVSNLEHAEDLKDSEPTAPDAFLPWTFSKYIHPEFPRGGRALDLAGGDGRHAIWLARQGWEVTLIDISEIGVEQARQNAGSLATHIRFVVDDLTGFKASQTPFDVVMTFYYLERSIFSEVVRSVRPGGLLLFKTYTSDQAILGGGPRSLAHLLNPGELRALAGGLDVLHYREDRSEKATAELVARKE